MWLFAEEESNPSIDLPVLSVPLQCPSSMLLGVQLVAAPYNEALILCAAKVLEAAGVVSASTLKINSFDI